MLGKIDKNPSLRWIFKRLSDIVYIAPRKIFDNQSDTNGPVV